MRRVVVEVGMHSLGGMRPTGRQLAGPAADLVELDGKGGLKHTAIVFRSEYRDDPALGACLHDVGGFLENPHISGLTALHRFLKHDGAFLYPTGRVFALVELIRRFAQRGQACGVKAGLEVAFLGGQILVEAAGVANQYGLTAHGALSPWRLMMRRDGQLAIIGYGVPPVELLGRSREDCGADSYRYCPPERLHDEALDLSSDLYSLSLVSLEVMLGRPVYDGSADDVRLQARRAEGARRLYQWREMLPEGVREAMGRALRFDRDARFRTGEEFLDAVHEQLSLPGVDGPGLIDLMRDLDVEAPVEPVREDKRPPDLAPPPEAQPEPEEDDASAPRWVSRGGRGRRRREAPEKSGARDLRSRRRTSSSDGGRERESSSRLRAPTGHTDPPRRLDSRLRDPSRRLRSREPRTEGPEEVERRGLRRSERTPAPSAPSESSSTGDLISRLRGGGSSGSPPSRVTGRSSRPSREGPPVPTVSSLEGAPDEAGQGPVTFKAVIGTGRAREVKVYPEDSLARTAWRITEQMGGWTTDLSGRLTGAWRVEQGDERWSGETRSVVLDARRRLNLRWVPNETRVTTIEVHDGVSVMRFQAPVGRAVPAFALLNHLKEWLGLSPEEPWRVLVDGEPLDPHQLVGEFPLGPDLVLEVRR